jgi:hypothetical protein
MEITRVKLGKSIISKETFHNQEMILFNMFK